MSRRSVVYFARMGGCVKIGHARDVRVRMAQLCLPMSAVVGTLPGGAVLEAQLHARFCGSRIEGSEWFEITPPLEKFLSTLGESRLRIEKRSQPVPEVPVRLMHDIPETAALLDTTEKVVKQLIAEEKLPAVAFGPRTIRISRCDIESFSAQFRAPLTTAAPARRSNARRGLDHQPSHPDWRSEMTVNTTTSTTAQAARDRRCPLCGRRPHRPCQRKPSGDHLARYLDAYTAGKLTRAYMAMVLGELVVITRAAVVCDLVREA